MMKKLLAAIACVVVLSGLSGAQETGKPKGTTLIGCLAGPDADDLYTLTSMEHRNGVQVAGGEELKQGAGAKVKLTGSWEALPGAEGKKSDATRRFRATDIAVMNDQCHVPAAVTPVSKKKQAQVKAAQPK